MKVLLTGASGFLGGKLCLALLAAGYSVRAFVWNGDPSPLHLTTDGAELAHGLELAYGDITDLESLVEACNGCEALFHVAALVESWVPNPSRFYSVNVGGLENVLKAFAKTETMKKLIYTSSYFAIGPTDGFIADEKQMHHGRSFCTEYEKSKFLADGIALKAAESGVPIVLLYPGVIYGPAGKVTTGNIVARVLIERFNGRLPGYIGKGHDISPFTHIDDVVNGHIAALQQGKLGERYLLTGENASFVQIFDMAAKITSTKKPRFHIPLWLMEAYGWILVFRSRITGTLPLISYPAVRALRHQWAYSCEKARRDLGYNPRNLEKGLTEMLDWLKSTKKIKY